jgi:hypothetical protein
MKTPPAGLREDDELVRKISTDRARPAHRIDFNPIREGA